MVFVLCCKRHFDADWTLFLAFLEGNWSTNELNVSISLHSFLYFRRAQWKVIWNEYFISLRGEKWTIMMKFYEPKAFSIIYPPCFCPIHPTLERLWQFSWLISIHFGIKLLWTLSIISERFMRRKLIKLWLIHYFFVDVDFSRPITLELRLMRVVNALGINFVQVCIFSIYFRYDAFRKRFILNIEFMKKTEAKFELLRKMSSTVWTKMKSTHDPISISSKWPLCVFVQLKVLFDTKQRSREVVMWVVNEGNDRQCKKKGES